MSTLYITEYAGGTINNAHLLAAAQEPPTAEQTVTYTTHAESSAFNNNTSLVRVTSDGVCSIAFGTAPVATTSNRRMAAGTAEYFGIPAGKSYKISAVSNT